MSAPSQANIDQAVTILRTVARELKHRTSRQLGMEIDAAVDLLTADLEADADELTLLRARVAKVEAYLAEPDDTQEWEHTPDQVERVEVVRVDRIRALLTDPPVNDVQEPPC